MRVRVVLALRIPIGADVARRSPLTLAITLDGFALVEVGSPRWQLGRVVAARDERTGFLRVPVGAAQMTAGYDGAAVLARDRERTRLRRTVVAAGSDDQLIA